MRIYIGGISTETNSFSPLLADYEAFRNGYVYEGAEIERLLDTSTEVKGYYEYLREVPEAEIVPGFVAFAIPSGPVRSEAFSSMMQRLLDSVKQAGRIDGILLALHGSMQAEGCDDCEGHILERVRGIVGDGVMIVPSYDMHCCLTPKMMQFSDGMAVYLTYPHTDHAKTGYRAAHCLVQMLKTGIRPRKLFKRMPLIMQVENCNTDVGPMVLVMDRFKAFLEKKGVISAGLCMAQPWLDTPELGCSIGAFIQPEADVPDCQHALDNVLDYIWENRQAFSIQIPGIEAALNESLGMDKPVCIVELGDIVSAGGVGDSTVALRALLDSARHRPACVMITDPETVRLAGEVGIGNTGKFLIGGSDGGSGGNGGSEEACYNQRVAVDAKVVFFNGDRIAPQGSVQTGVAVNAGMRVLLQTADGLNIIASELPCMNHDKQMLISMGVESQNMNYIIQKTHQMFKEGFKGVMGSFIYADTPGYTDRNLARLPFKKVKRPIFPLDE